jgi:uncharacterized damage-inducible protein DinB
MTHPRGNFVLHLHAGHLWFPERVTTEREHTPTTAGERRSLRGYLDFHRATLAMKCDDLTDDQLRRQASPPSTLSLLGLVRHLADVERGWFRRVIDKQEAGPLYGDFAAAYDASGATREEAFAAWQAEVAESRRIEQAAESLDVTAHSAGWGQEVSLRMVMQHMIQEYARHNGHADLLREAIDGVTGV